MQEDLQESFSRELHDEFGQLLTAIGMLLGRVKKRLPAESPLVADLEEVRGIVQQTLEKIRTESRMLHPVVLDDFGLEKALAWYVEQYGRQHGIDAQFQKSGPVGLIPPEATIHIYRIVQEALTNVSRHSGSTEAWVRLQQVDDRVELEIEDRGRGLPPEADRKGGWEGIGLISMRERTELMGGEFLAPAGGPRRSGDQRPGAARHGGTRRSGGAGRVRRGGTHWLSTTVRNRSASSSWTTTPWCARASGASSKTTPTSP